jgi:hypothetical protein
MEMKCLRKTFAPLYAKISYWSFRYQILKICLFFCCEIILGVLQNEIPSSRVADLNRHTTNASCIAERLIFGCLKRFNTKRKLVILHIQQPVIGPK